MLGEAKRLYDLGFAIHWLQPESKVPVKAKWASGVKDTFTTLKKEYHNGYNMGCQLGQASKVDGGYLAALDVDVKSSDPKHAILAKQWIEKNFPGLLDDAPTTMSGRGNGSRHIWMRLENVVESQKLYSSPEMVEVLMGSAPANKRQIELLGQDRVDEGWRLRPAFEIDFMMRGRQIVVPPSIHPDTGKRYFWSRPVGFISDIPIVDLTEYFEERHKKGDNAPINKTSSIEMQSWEPVDVDYLALETKLTSSILGKLYEGTDVEDRSASCFSVAMAMVKARFDDNTIMTVLTDTDNFLGSVAFEHAKTESRSRAARWIKDYNIQKARTQVDAAFIFDCEVEILPPLSDEEVERNDVEMSESGEWQDKLERTDSKDGPGRIKPTALNTKMILQHGIDFKVVTYDEFAMREQYGCDTPWGTKAGEIISETELISQKMWIAKHFRVEPSVNIVNEAVNNIRTQNSFHPVRQYLDSLEWDGTCRIDTWIKDYLGGEAPEEYLRAISRKFLVAGVARIFQPGRKFDHMVVFQGNQGIGKSSVGSILAGQKWFSDHLGRDLSDKDAALGLVGIWINEMGELSALKKNEIEEVKAFVVRQVDKVRPPFERKVIEVYRQNIFFGSTNKDEYLVDETGNRRFWPVKVSKVDFDKLVRDRDQLWAEAAFVFHNFAEKLYLEGLAKEQAELTQASKLVTTTFDIMEEKFSEWLQAEDAKSMVGVHRLKLRDLFEGYGDDASGPFLGQKMDNYTLQMAARLARKFGFEKRKSNGLMVWVRES